MTAKHQARFGLRVLLMLGWPVIVTRLTQSVIGFADAYMTASLGEDALAATTTGSFNVFSIVILPMGIAFIVQSFGAQLAGKKDFLGARRYAWYGLILAGLVTVLGALSTPLIRPLLGLLDYQPAVHDMMSEYLEIRLFALGGIVGTEVLGSWYAGLGNTRLQMIAGVVAMLCNVALNWVLIYGNLGAPALGVEGAALASLLASWAGFGVLAYVFARGWGTGDATGRIRGKDGLRLSEFFRMLRFGIPNGINWFLEMSAFTLFINVVVAGLGTSTLAAMMVVFQINSLAFMPAFGLSSAGAILVGQAIGGGRRDEVGQIVWRTVRVASAWHVLVGILYLAIPEQLMDLFDTSTGDSSEFYELGVLMLAISAAWQLFDAIGMAVGEALRAAGDTSWSMWARLLVGWLLFIPTAFVSVNLLDGGPIAATLCVVLYLMVIAACISWRFLSGAWRHIDLTGDEAAIELV
ncbi:MAG: MATE family efflux transporter [Haliangiales bacterium]